MDPRLGNLIDAGCDALHVGDNDRAIEYFSLPAELGISIAMFNLAIAHNRRGDVEEAIRWYTAAAKAGDDDAMAYLGWAFRLLGDLDRATKWYEMAATHGNANAAKMIQSLPLSDPAASTERGPGLEAVGLIAADRAKYAAAAGSMDQAVELWTMAAEFGDGESMFNLGLAAERRSHLGEAILWHTAAARAGFEGAAHRLTAIASTRRLGPSPAGNG